MPSYDTLARVTIDDSSTEPKVYEYETVETSFTEKFDTTILVPNTASDQEIDLGGVATASFLRLRSSSEDAIQLRLSGVGNTQYSLTDGVLLFTGAAITSLHVTIPGSNDITLEVLAMS